jgi:sortase A
VENDDKSGRRTRGRAITIISRSLIVAGIALMGYYGLARLHSVVESRMAIRQFKQSESVRKKAVPGKPPSSTPEKEPRADFSLWSTNRVAAYKETLIREFPAPEAVLEIPRIGLEVPVFEGTDSLTLNRGVGRIEGTAHLGEGGNLGIAGHRDGFFRGLKDLVVGDTIELDTTDGRETYRVDQIQIVKPNDVRVLKNRAAPTLTLVTCYPFYYLGSAPLRYIVQATVLDEHLNGKGNTKPN